MAIPKVLYCRILALYSVNILNKGSGYVASHPWIIWIYGPDISLMDNMLIYKNRYLFIVIYY